MFRHPYGGSWGLRLPRSTADLVNSTTDTYLQLEPEAHVFATVAATLNNFDSAATGTITDGGAPPVSAVVNANLSSVSCASLGLIKIVASAVATMESFSIEALDRPPLEPEIFASSSRDWVQIVGSGKGYIISAGSTQARRIVVGASTDVED